MGHEIVAGGRLGNTLGCTGTTLIGGAGGAGGAGGKDGATLTGVGGSDFALGELIVERDLLKSKTESCLTWGVIAGTTAGGAGGAGGVVGC